MQASQTEAPTPEVVLDSGSWISGPSLDVPHRRLARDVRTNRVGVIMATPDELGTQRQFWLRPVGGGIEWTAPREYVQLLTSEGASE